METEHIRPDEIRPMRERIGALVASRMHGVLRKPLDPERFPPEVVHIVALVLEEFRRNFPDGLPPAPQDQLVVARYMKRAVALYDQELADQFTLGDTA
jgi:hypothetical protein